MRIGITRALSELEAGDTIAVQSPDPFKKTDEVKYFLVRCGHGLTRTNFERLRPQLAEVGDGLFGTSQTYRLDPSYRPPERKRRRAATQA